MCLLRVKVETRSYKPHCRAGKLPTADLQNRKGAAKFLQDITNFYHSSKKELFQVVMFCL